MSSNRSAFKSLEEYADYLKEKGGSSRSRMISTLNNIKALNEMSYKTEDPDERLHMAKAYTNLCDALEYEACQILKSIAWELRKVNEKIKSVKKDCIPVNKKILLRTYKSEKAELLAERKYLNKEFSF